MKKTISILSLILSLLVSTMAFTACGSDDDDNNSPSNPLIGTWYFENDNVYHDHTNYTEMSFFEDMTFTYRVYTLDRNTLIRYDKGTYIIEGDILWTTWEKYSSPPRRFRVEGNKLITDEGGETIWTKK